MEVIEVGYSSNGNTSLKNNRKLKERKGFFKSYKELEYKHNLQEHKHNENIKKMSSYEMQILKLKLKREKNFKMLKFVLMICLVVISVLYLVKFV